MTHPVSLRTLPGGILAITALIGALISPGCGSSDVSATDPAGDGGVLDAGGDTSSPDDGSALADSGSRSDANAATDSNAATDANVATDADDANAAKYVTLKTAGSFVVLAGQTVTNTGFTVINGDVGISPGTAITGFPPGIVNGTIHSADAVAAQAKLDLNDARDEAISMSGAPKPLSGDLGGMTLRRGLYQSSTQMLVSSGDLTLDAQGDQNAIWVFQIQTTFVIMVNRKVVLINNAKPDNIFWNVGSSATIGVGSLMVGNFLTQTSITVQTGATMDGRFLTQTGSVTFDSNNINRPPPIIH